MYYYFSPVLGSTKVFTTLEGRSSSGLLNIMSKIFHAWIWRCLEKSSLLYLVMRWKLIKPSSSSRFHEIETTNLWWMIEWGRHLQNPANIEMVFWVKKSYLVILLLGLEWMTLLLPPEGQNNWGDFRLFFGGWSQAGFSVAKQGGKAVGSSAAPKSFVTVAVGSLILAQ